MNYAASGPAIERRLRTLWEGLTAPRGIHDPDRAQEFSTLSSLLLFGTLITLLGAPSHLLQPETVSGTHALRLAIRLLNAVFTLVAYLLHRRDRTDAALVTFTLSWFANVYLETILLQGTDDLILMMGMLLPISLWGFFRTLRSGSIALLLGLALILSLVWWLPPGPASKVPQLAILFLFANVLALTGLRVVHHSNEVKRGRILASERHYRDVLDSINDVVLTLDQNGLIQHANRSAERSLNWRESWITGRPLHELVHPDDAAKLQAALVDVLLGTQTVITLEFSVRDADGRCRPFEFTMRASTTLEGRRTVTASGRDLTERKQAEAERVRSAVEEEQWTLLRRFVASISHDFRTSLSNIETSRYLIERKLTDPQRVELRPRMLQITGQVARLNEQIENLSMLSSLTTSSRSLVEITRVVQSAAAHHAARAAELHVALHAEPGPHKLYVLGDEHHLFHAVSQLVVNALSHTEAEGTVGLLVNSNGGEICIVVADTGTGIPPEHLSQIFEAFYRIDAARSISSGGVGIGLTIVQMVMSAHHGHVAVESEVGKGTTFTLYLPAAHPEDEAEFSRLEGPVYFS